MARSEAPNQPNLLESLRARDRRFALVEGTGRRLFEDWKKSPELRSQPIEEFLLVVEAEVGGALGLRGSDFALTEECHIDRKNFIRLKGLLLGKGAKQIIMRHGTQLSDIPSKIDMMRLPQNMTQPLTDLSLAQATTTAVGLAIIAYELGKPIQVRSSKNERALQTAGLVASIAGGVFTTDARLNCINYPPREEVSDEELLDRMGRENNGALLWEKERVDSVVGEGTYEQISQDILDLRQEVLSQKGNFIEIDVTHTQQTNAADVLVGATPSRLREFGMRINQSLRSSTLLAKGIFVK